VEDEDFDQVLAAARLGAEWALTRMYRQLHPALLRYMRAHVADDAEDLAADVWIEIAAAIPGFSGDADGFRRLVFTVAHRRSIDHGRKRLRRRTDPTEPADFVDARGRDETEVDAIERAEGDDAVRRILALLPEKQAEVVLLRVVGGLSVSEVAAIVGRPPATVSMMQHRALQRLARRLDGSRG
jgi:RNA polymerase sigma-70 factor (ECF subfamily)